MSVDLSKKKRHPALSSMTSTRSIAGRSNSTHRITNPTRGDIIPDGGTFSPTLKRRQR